MRNIHKTQCRVSRHEFWVDKHPCVPLALHSKQQGRGRLPCPKSSFSKPTENLVLAHYGSRRNMLHSLFCILLISNVLLTFGEAPPGS